MTANQVSDSSTVPDRGAVHTRRYRAWRNQAYPLHSIECPGCLTTATRRGEDLNDWRRADHPLSYLFILGCVVAAGVVALGARLGVW